jgi:hypothetical protein
LYLKFKNRLGLKSSKAAQAVIKITKINGKSSPFVPKTAKSRTSGKEGAEAHQHQVHFCGKYVPDPSFAL